MKVIDYLDKLLESIGIEPWVVQVFIVVFATLLVAYVAKRVLRHLTERLQRTENLWDDALIDSMQSPMRGLIWIIGIAFAAEIAAHETQAPIFAAVDPIRDVGVIAMIAWFLVRFIAAAEERIVHRHERDGETYDRTTLDAVAKLLKLSVAITAALVALQTLGFSVSGVLAFGGIGGIAVGFAAKDLLANFFGGLMIYLDRPFAVGDWIRSPDRDIEGTVEKIGWRLCCIRTFDSRPLYIPNATFTSIAVENPSRMQNRRIFETIGVRYDDAGVVGKIVADVKAMLESHPDIEQDRLLMVNFDKFAASSLDFFIYCFTKTRKWAEFHQVKQDVLLKILDIIASHGAEVAFPTSTIHVPEGIPGLAEALPEVRADRAAE
ncbi:MAG: mechanosensitive ion channel family protein [Gammaproteobacteria bacterium]|nr:mechanosensitive ion channel family protein [Gammaproteobacteria bacterium]